MLLLSILVASLGLYAVAYWFLLEPDTCIYASKSGVLRLRHERYRRGGQLLEHLFAPMALIDLMVRKAYWMQSDIATLQLEDVAQADQLSLVERIGTIGGMVTWHSDKVSVTFLGRPVSDDALEVFQEFVLVDDLCLAGSGISDDGLRHLTALKRLRHLDIDGTQVSDEAIEQFKLAVPACYVWTGK